MTQERERAWAGAFPRVTLISMRVLCLVSGHKWTPAAEAADPQDAGAAYVKSYGGDDLVLVCKRCGHPKVISTEDFHQFIRGASGYGSRTTE